MKMRIKEFAALTGVTVRTLHYYHQIGLLKPAFTDEITGYRYYDYSCLLRMQQILFYRELDFSLKSILKILSSPDYNKKEALAQQKQLLTLKKERLDKLIFALDEAMKGENVMHAFDHRQLDEYKAEVKQRWGQTEAFKEHRQKTKDYTDNQWQKVTEGMEEIFKKFADCVKKGTTPVCPEAQQLVKELQQYITQNFYTCTNEILMGLGQMYVMDERFQNNIDRHGSHTAQFVQKAISHYCKK